MRTTIKIDDALFTEVMRLTSAKTKTEAVRTALSEFIRLVRKQQLLALRGKLELVENWRELREREASEVTDG